MKPKQTKNLKFTLQHTVLYAKNWYKRSDNFWEDMKACLNADDYMPDDKNDCVGIILSQFDKLDYKQYRDSKLSFLSGILPANCYKFGYYTKGNCDWLKEQPTNEYDVVEAAIRYCLSHFVQLGSDEWNVCEPDFKKCLPRRKGVAK